ncbi:hypothetical protein GW916_00380 [bacterium]|nr:hypothetical protein [bacterium]
MYATSVYYLVTFLITFFTFNTKAQLLNLSTVSGIEYQGVSETLGGKPCIVRSSFLEKNFMGRLTQSFELLTLETDGRSVERRHVLQLNPITRDKAPITCDKKSKACLWEFVVSKALADEASSGSKGDKEFYYLVFESYLKNPEQFYLVSLLKAGSATGARRLHWDCVVRKFKSTEALPSMGVLPKIPKAIPVAE